MFDAEIKFNRLSELNFGILIWINIEVLKEVEERIFWENKIQENFSRQVFKRSQWRKNIYKS